MSTYLDTLPQELILILFKHINLNQNGANLLSVIPKYEKFNQRLFYYHTYENKFYNILKHDNSTEELLEDRFRQLCLISFTGWIDKTDVYYRDVIFKDNIELYNDLISLPELKEFKISINTDFSCIWWAIYELTLISLHSYGMLTAYIYSLFVRTLNPAKILEIIDKRCNINMSMPLLDHILVNKVLLQTKIKASEDDIIKGFVWLLDKGIFKVDPLSLYVCFIHCKLDLYNLFITHYDLSTLNQETFYYDITKFLLKCKHNGTLHRYRDFIKLIEKDNPKLIKTLKKMGVY